MNKNQRRDRGRGVMLGQLIGDALGTSVEFSDPQTIARRYPAGLREIVGGGPFHVLPGQVTDDSELALALARTLVAHEFDVDARAKAYAAWMRSGPFDVGNTTRAAFGGVSNDVSAEQIFQRAKAASGAKTNQANGALMRVSPMAIFGAHLDPQKLVELAAEDARFSHPSAVCQAANALYVRAIQVGLHGGTREEAYEAAKIVAAETKEVADALAHVAAQPVCAGSKQGWVLTALRNAFHVLLHEETFEDALVKTVMAGGDADTNACIAGALLGAFYGIEGIPPRWIVKVLACRTDRGPTYQTADAIVLADALFDGVATKHAAPRRGSSSVRTSESHPIRVDWLRGQTTAGKVGLTFAPGKHSRSKYSGGEWRRDLDQDLDVLAREWKASVLVCLLEDGDLARLKITNYVERAEARGFEVIRLPIRDVAVFPDTRPVHALVQTILARATAGKNVVIHCEGGLGRAGTIGGCYLALVGHDGDAVLKMLIDSRKNSNCPETEEQREFVRAFAREYGNQTTPRPRQK